MPDAALLKRTQELALEFLATLPHRRVGPAVTVDELRAALGGPLPEQGEEPLATIERLARAADPGLVGMAGPRYFGFVIGGHLPAALAADWLTSAWDQNAALYVSSPASSVAEEVAAGWLLEILGLPRTASVGFTTGGMMANFTALAAARHAVLQRRGWDVEARGLYGAPEIDVVIGDEAHATILAALQMLGLGRERVKRVPADGQGRMEAAALREVLRSCDGPLIVCSQAGNVNTGAFDPLDEIATAVRERRRLAPRRRGVRPLGAGGPGARPPRPRRRAGRLLGRRQPQVAQRPLRLRNRDRQRPAGAPGGDDDRRALPRPDRRQ